MCCFLIATILITRKEKEKFPRGKKKLFQVKIYSAPKQVLCFYNGPLIAVPSSFSSRLKLNYENQQCHSSIVIISPTQEEPSSSRLCLIAS
jgi:hypothetical protein